MFLFLFPSRCFFFLASTAPRPPPETPSPLPIFFFIQFVNWPGLPRPWNMCFGGMRCELRAPVRYSPRWDLTWLPSISHRPYAAQEKPAFGFNRRVPFNLPPWLG